MIYAPSVFWFPVTDALRRPSFRFWRPPSRQSLGTAEDLTHVRVSVLMNFSSTSQVRMLLGGRQHRWHRIRRMKGYIV
jgi:hypothetical protein